MRLAVSYHQIIAVGGLERYLLRFIQEMKSVGNQLVLITGEVDAAGRALGVEIHELGFRHWPRSLRLPLFSSAVESVRPKLGVDLMLGFGRTVAQDVHRAGGGCHAIYSRLLTPLRRWSLKNRIELALERQLYTSGRTRHFVVNSTMVARQLREKYGVTPSNLEVIHTPVDSAHFHPPERRPHRERPILLFVSSHHRRKGLDALLTALRRIRNAELWIAGAPVSGGYQALIERFSLADRVRWLGQIDDLAATYREADFFVHPTLYDACANTVLQAMASGLPSVVSVADGASEFVDPGVSGYLLQEPAKGEALADTLSTALALSHEEREVMGLAARHRVLPLTWKAHIDTWTALCERLRQS